MSWFPDLALPSRFDQVLNVDVPNVQGFARFVPILVVPVFGL